MEIRVDAAISEEETMGQLPIPYKIPDIEKVKTTFPEVIKTLDAMFKRTQEITVDTAEADEEVVFLGATAAEIIKQLEEKRKSVIGPFDTFVGKVNKWVKIFRDKAESIKELAGKKNAQWMNFVEQERQKKEAEAIKAAHELEEKLKKDADEINKKNQEEALRKAQEEAKAKGIDPSTIEAPKVPLVEAPLVVQPIIPKKDTVIRTEAGSAGISRKRVPKIVDLDQVPIEYLRKAIRKGDKHPTESEKLLISVLKEAMDGGTDNIPGVEIVEEIDSKFRTR